MKSLTRTELTAIVARGLSVHRSEVRLVVDSIIKVIMEQLMSGRGVKLHGFGVLELRPHAGCMANACVEKGGIKKGAAREFVEVPAHMRIWFTPCPALRRAVLKVPVPATFQPRRR